MQCHEEQRYLLSYEDLEIKLNLLKRRELKNSANIGFKISNNSISISASCDLSDSKSFLKNWHFVGVKKGFFPSTVIDRPVFDPKHFLLPPKYLIPINEDQKKRLLKLFSPYSKSKTYSYAINMIKNKNLIPPSVYKRYLRKIDEL